MQTAIRTGNDSYSDDEQRWQAVMERDARADGEFVYGVTSTGIFCRPTCPSRRPGKSRVKFFETPGQARGSGFRPCKRCRPEAATADAEFVQSIVDAIEGWQDGRPTLADLAELVDLSPWHLQRKFKAATGVSPAAFARQRRIDKFRAELKGGRDVTSSIYEAGFESSAALYESADRELGMTPANYKAGGEDLEIHYLTAETDFGRLLLAYTGAGVAAILFGDDDGELSEQLAQEFPNATLIGAAGDHPWLQTVLDYLGGDSPHPDLPLDIQGTAFQRRVWQAIRVIPAGETRSYGEIAAEIGKPSAVRAVANACGQNRLAMAIPCHRVVRADGSGGGYRWGGERKAALLALEAV